MTLPRFESDAALEAHRLAALRTLITTLCPGNAFYAPRLRAAGLERGPASLETFTAAMPFTRKRDLAEDQDRHPPWGTNLTFPIDRYSRVHETSSTTGRPLRWLDTPESWLHMLDGWQEVFEAASVTAADRVFVAFSFGPFIGLWMAFDAAARMGCLAIPGGGMSSALRLQAILANSVSSLCCTPTYAIRLGEVAAEEGLDLSRSSVRRIVVGGEPGASVPATRARIESLWPGARVFDHYGMTEVGPVTFQCRARTDAVHVIESQHLIEIVDPQTGDTLPAGREAVTGELVTTTLMRTGSPVLRYRTGDVVRALPAEPCACGRRTLLFEGGIIGRTDDMVIVRGVNLYPSAVEQVIRSVPGVGEYRVEISTNRGLSELRVLVEPAATCDDPAALGRHIEKAFRDGFNLRVPVVTVAPGALPRFELKARRWIRK